VAVGMSGGVDSSVAALHFQRQVIPFNFLLQIFLKTLLSF
jgi:tRNA U34 2-thiouridine synthase MnmA/TrmU